MPQTRRLIILLLQDSPIYSPYFHNFANNETGFFAVFATAFAKVLALGVPTNANASSVDPLRCHGLRNDGRGPKDEGIDDEADKDDNDVDIEDQSVRIVEVSRCKVADHRGTFTFVLMTTPSTL